MSDSRVYQFVDTNILVYAFDRSAGTKHEIAREHVARLWDEELGCLSIQVLQEFYVTVTQKIRIPLAPDQAAKILVDLGQWRVHSPSVRDVQSAIEIQTRYRVSFWDSMILCSAVQLGCDLLWTEDLNPGQRYMRVLAQNPFTALAD